MADIIVIRLIPPGFEMAAMRGQYRGKVMTLSAETV
jgi:hypothetical protein